MVEAEQVEPGVAGALLGDAIVIRPHQESPPRSFFGRVGQRKRFVHRAIAAQQGAAAFVRERLPAVRADRRVRRPLQHQPHQFVPPTSAPSGGFSQNRSDR